MTQPFPLAIQFKASELIYKIRFNDCDPMGHLNNSSYIDYFINAMEDFIKLNYKVDLAEELAKGFGWVVRDHQLLYLKPVGHHQNIHIKVEFVSVLEKEFQVEMQMLSEHGDQLFAMIRSNFSCINTHEGRRTAHPERLFFGLCKGLNLDLASFPTLADSYQAIRKTKSKMRRANQVKEMGRATQT